MSAQAIIERAENAGLVLSLGDMGRLKYSGNAHAFELMRSELVEHKAAILEALGLRTRTKPTNPHALFCTLCGPIHANEKPVDRAGYGYGMPIVSACEWCRSGKSPSTRPTVSCSTCKHFRQADLTRINGAGNCAADAVPAGMAQRSATLVCGAWVPSRVAGDCRIALF